MCPRHRFCVQALLTALASSGSGRDVCQAVETALPVLLERLSDNNSRLRDSARDALVALAQEPEGRGALRMQAGHLCKAPRNQTAWRPVLAMLQLMMELVPLLGVVSSGAGGRSSSSDSSSGGFDLQVRRLGRGCVRRRVLCPACCGQSCRFLPPTPALYVMMFVAAL